MPATAFVFHTLSNSDGDIASPDKEKFLKKHGLFLENGSWYQEKENSHKHLIFHDSFYRKGDILSLLFRYNKLCMAKKRYFREHLNDFLTLRHHYKERFVETELRDSEFFKHLPSGCILNFRFLQSIRHIQDFQKLCKERESLQPLPHHKTKDCSQKKEA